MEAIAVLSLDSTCSMRNETGMVGQNYGWEVGTDKVSAVRVHVVWPEDIVGIETSRNMWLGRFFRTGSSRSIRYDQGAQHDSGCELYHTF